MASLDNITEGGTRAEGMDELSNVLRNVHAQNLASYSHLLKEESRTTENEPVNTVDNEVPFWDIVVVTAGDKQQKQCYQRRIDQKLTDRSIPSRARYLVIEDPPNSKIGSAGSTCLVMKILQETFPADFLLQARTLLIHAGGYSTRLPHVSARGKIFTALPQADKPKGIQVLDLKLVLYIHLLKSMPPGVFLTSADGIELFSSCSPFPKDPKPFTITALAHPSSTQIGSTHGVYLLHDPEGLIPTDHEMRRTPKLIYNSSSASEGQEEEVYTDSCYYFDPHTAALMANVYPRLSPECDLEAWADVLSFQDSCPSNQETGTNIRAITQQPLKQTLLDANVQLDVMVLNASKFYHLGTMLEFIFATCTDRAFMSELNIRNSTPGVAIISALSLSIARIQQQQQKQEQQDQETSQWQLESPLFIENCHIPPTAQIGAGSVLVDTNLPDTKEGCEGRVQIPAHTCMFTLQLQEHAFVTFTFSVNDDMKRAVSATTTTSSEETNDDTHQILLKRLMIFESVPVSEMLTNNNNNHNNDLKHEHEHRPPTSQIQACGDSLSLWTAPVFEIASTAQESTRFALDRLARIRRFQTGGERPSASPRSTAPMLGWVSLKDAARIAREL
ncbi:hypothetical protein EC957_000685 [Mortierella hygrophila]|uniref:GDP-fucose pyrophosphorylase domain-containing protein n=1 Tax=Mortierella hygrophila TaxID=979708 RepID=A0A9P6FGM2_9FUNG|nr:hypothetical protein EC957_000685 [Mortierella hygrophila]